MVVRFHTTDRRLPTSCVGNVTFSVSVMLTSCRSWRGIGTACPTCALRWAGVCKQACFTFVDLPAPSQSLWLTLHV